MRNFENKSVRLEIRLTPDCVALLMMRGHDSVLGARALRTVFEVEVEGAVADALLRMTDKQVNLHLELGVVGATIIAKSS